MAGKRIIHFNRDNFLTSDRCRQMDAEEKAAYFTSLLLLARSEEKSPLRGCLCVGSAPMTVREWGIEVGFSREPHSRRIWESLIARGLLEWFEYEGQRYGKVARFERNQDRLKGFGADKKTTKKDRRNADGKAQNQDSSTRFQHTFDTVSDRFQHTFDTVSEHAKVDTKGVTPQNSWKPPQEPLTSLTYPNPNGLVTAVGVEAPDANSALGALESEYAERVKRLQDSDAPDDVKRQMADRYKSEFERRRKALDTNAGANVGAIVPTVLQEAENRNAGNRNGSPRREAKDTGKDTAEDQGAPSRQELRATAQYVADLLHEHPRQWARAVKRFSHSGRAWTAFGLAVAEVEAELKRRPDAGASAMQRPGAILNTKLDEIAVRLRLWREDETSVKRTNPVVI